MLNIHHRRPGAGEPSPRETARQSCPPAVGDHPTQLTIEEVEIAFKIPGGRMVGLCFPHHMPIHEFELLEISQISGAYKVIDKGNENVPVRQGVWQGCPMGVEPILSASQADVPTAYTTDTRLSALQEDAAGGEGFEPSRHTQHAPPASNRLPSPIGLPSRFNGPDRSRTDRTDPAKISRPQRHAGPV